MRLGHGTAYSKVGTIDVTFVSECSCTVAILRRLVETVRFIRSSPGIVCRGTVAYTYVHI